MQQNNQVQAELIHNGVGGRDHKRFIAYGHFEPNEVAEFQTQLGFDPNGYGFPMQVKRGLDVLNRQITTWACSGSCD